MVYAGTETTTWEADGRLGVSFVGTGFDADAETSSSFDSHAAGYRYTLASCKIARTAGSTNVVAVKVQGSHDNITFEDTDIAITTWIQCAIATFTDNSRYVRRGQD